jgi:hypothetical protein
MLQAYHRDQDLVPVALTNHETVMEGRNLRMRNTDSK